MSSLSEKELRIQVYLASRESELADYITKVINAKEINKRTARYMARLDGIYDMTPQEEKYKLFYNNTQNQVLNMSDIDLEAFIEEMKDICFTGKAALSAANDEKKRRKQTNKKTGFITSVETDQISTDAINRINNRKEKLNRIQKAVEGMVKSGIPRAEAERIASARNIRDTLPAIKTQLQTTVESLTDTKDGVPVELIKTPEPVDTSGFKFDDPFEKR